MSEVSVHACLGLLTPTRDVQGTARAAPHPQVGRCGVCSPPALLVHRDLQKPQAVSLPPPNTKSTPLQ